jgi:hypothetical protein
MDIFVKLRLSMGLQLILKGKIGGIQNIKALLRKRRIVLKTKGENSAKIWFSSRPIYFLQVDKKCLCMVLTKIRYWVS